MKQFLTALLCIFIFHVNAQTDDSLLVYSDAYHLKWSDFKGTAPENSGFHATTDWGISFSYNYDGNVLNFKLVCNFLPYASWVLSEFATDSLLMHEQLHLDIAELYSRKIRKEITEHPFTVKNLKKDAERIYNHQYNECVRMQKLYDKETMHSTKKEKQKEWEKTIRKELKSLSKYSTEKYSIFKKQPTT